VSWLGDVVLHLRAHAVPHALIGAGALAVHGVSRATHDVDLLTVERAVLEATFWDPLRGGPGSP
jgi:hypothetical protein